MLTRAAAAGLANGGSGVLLLPRKSYGAASASGGITRYPFDP
jgi:hypothetical protein